LIAYGLKLIGILMSIFGPNYTVFSTGRFLMGVGSSYYATNFIIGNIAILLSLFQPHQQLLYRT